MYHFLNRLLPGFVVACNLKHHICYCYYNCIMLQIPLISILIKVDQNTSFILMIIIKGKYEYKFTYEDKNYYKHLKLCQCAHQINTMCERCIYVYMIHSKIRCRSDGQINNYSLLSISIENRCFPI